MSWFLKLRNSRSFNLHIVHWHIHGVQTIYICLTNAWWFSLYSSCSGWERLDTGKRGGKNTEALAGVCQSKIKSHRTAGDDLLRFISKVHSHKAKSKFLFLNKIVLTNFKICIVGYVSQISEIQDLKLTLPILCKCGCQISILNTTVFVAKIHN